MTDTTVSSRSTLARIGHRTDPEVRLVCIPYAGAGVAAFRAFPAALPAAMEVWAVRLPAREGRLAEAPLEHIRPVVDTIADEIDIRLGDLPLALYGHSMGALVAFELARTLRRRGRPAVRHLFVSGRRAPRLPDELPTIHRLPVADFLAAVTKLDGIPAQVLSEPGLIELIVPALRADFAVCETYTYAEEPPLDCPITVFGGTADPTTTPAQLQAWCEESSVAFRSRYYEGDHFFLHPHTRSILAAMAEDLRLAGGA
jgi:medium-chain acyl-[acyl-carrier-protein] hydrolase